MPRIQVYTHNKAVIPVDQAVKRSGFICPWTKDIFLTKASYLKHLRHLRETRMHRRARQRRRDRKMQELWNLKSFEEIVNWIDLNPEPIFEMVKGMRFSTVKEADLREKFHVELSYLDVRHAEQVSNTHHAPHGKSTNWGREPGKPTSYPGWVGRVEFRVLPEGCGIGASDVGRALRINTGTGGGTSNGYYGYDVRMFEEDWPGLSREFAEHMVTAKLSDDKLPVIPSNLFHYGVKRY